jgi:hypothetical protein
VVVSLMDDLKTSMVTFLRQDDLPDFVAVLIRFGGHG